MNSKLRNVSSTAQLFASVAVIMAVPISLLQLGSIGKQIESVEKHSAMDILMRLEDRMNSDPIQTAFGIFSETGQQIRSEDIARSDELGRSIRTLGNFYESIALCVNNGYLPFDDANRLVGGDLLTFYDNVENAIKSFRIERKEPEAFAELERLALRIREEQALFID